MRSSTKDSIAGGSEHLLNKTVGTNPSVASQDQALVRGLTETSSSAPTTK